MAEILTEEPVWFNSRKGRYSWDTWFDGQVWELKNGGDFTVAPGAFAAAARQAAKVRGLDLKVKIAADSVIVKAVKKQTAPVSE